MSTKSIIILGHMTKPGVPEQIEALRPWFESAGVWAVRWASIPGRINAYGGDLFDLQISYCDTRDQSPGDLSRLLSAGGPGRLGALKQWVCEKMCI